MAAVSSTFGPALEAGWLVILGFLAVDVNTPEIFLFMKKKFPGAISKLAYAPGLSNNNGSIPACQE